MKLKPNIAVSDSGLVFNPLNGESYSLNPIAIELLNQVKEQKAYEKIESLICEKFDVDKITFEKDFLDFVSMLKQYQLLEDE